VRARTFADLSACILVLCLAACAPSAPSTQSPAGAAAGSATASPVPAGSAPGSSTSSADWQAQWNQTLAAARQEGVVAVAGPPGERYRAAITAFEKAHPEIRLDLTGGLGRDLIPRILGERENGLFNWDVIVTGSSNAFDLIPAGAIQPLKPALILPQIVDDSQWFDGFDAGFHDKAKQYAFGFMGTLSYQVYVNRDVVSEAELAQFDQLLDPRWKGRITWVEPRLTGVGATVAGQLHLVKGEDYLRQLLAQDVVAVNDPRQHAEFVVRGRYPIGVGVSSDRLAEFQEQGIGKNVVPLDPRGPAGARIASGFSALMFVDRAPHPNAAKVFINWLLDKDAQALWVDASNTNSRRIDVPGPASTALYPEVERRTVNDEAYFDYELKAREIAKQVLR